MVSKIDVIDRRLSSLLHESTSKLVEMFLLPFGVTFSPIGIGLVILLVVLGLIFVEAELSGSPVPTPKD